jgi:hypothetical protein
MSLLSMIQSPKVLFFEHKARKMGFIKLALVFIRIASLSNAAFIFSIIDSYSLMSSKASVNSFEKNFESISREFSF